MFLKLAAEWSKAVLTLLIVMFMLESSLSLFLIKHNAFVHFEPRSDLSDIHPKIHAHTPSDMRVLCRATPQQTMQEVMNIIRSKGDVVIAPKSEAIADIWDAAQRGAVERGVFNCNHMSELLVHALLLQNIPVRKVFVAKNFGDFYTSHTVVEVLQEGRWVVFDPTFNVSYKADGKLLGAQDIAALLYRGDYKKIRPHFFGDVLYPARLDKYYTNWLNLYNNILIFDARNWPMIPKFLKCTLGLFVRYWQGPVMYYYALRGANSYLAALDWLYWSATCVIPLCILLLFFCYAIALYNARKK